MTMQEGGAADRQLHERAYFLDLLGDSHNGLGRHDAAIEAHRQAAEGFREQGAQCSYALCLLKIAGSYLSLDEPWHAIGYLEACLPLLRDLGLVRHETTARQQLIACRAVLAEAHLLGEGRVGRSASDHGRPARPASTVAADPATGGQRVDS
jgi:tetratricopeptide (TPR) repeat protein